MSLSLSQPASRQHLTSPPATRTSNDATGRVARVCMPLPLAPPTTHLLTGSKQPCKQHPLQTDATQLHRALRIPRGIQNMLTEPAPAHPLSCPWAYMCPAACGACKLVACDHGSTPSIQAALDCFAALYCFAAVLLEVASLRCELAANISFRADFFREIRAPSPLRSRSIVIVRLMAAWKLAFINREQMSLTTARV